MADVAVLRESLATFLGDDRFRKFVHQGLRRGRLRYWQEQEWARFIAANPQFDVALDELATALRICELHRDELLPDTVEVIHGNRDYAGWYIEARNRLFPNAATEPYSTEGGSFEADRFGVWYCPSCRRAQAEWERSRRTNR